MKHSSRLAALALFLPLLGMLPMMEATSQTVAEGSSYGRQIMVANADGTGQSTIRSVGNNFSPRWSPDGSQIVMTSDRNGGWDVYVHDLASNEEVRITNSQDGANADWSPNNELVFSYDFGTLGMRSADGTGSIRNLPKLDNIFFTQPVFSPNGELIASYGETVNGGPKLVYVQKADGTGVPVALEGQEGLKNWQPEWQSDSVLTYVSMRQDGTYLITFNLETKETTVGKKVNGLGEVAWNSSGSFAYSWYDSQRMLIATQQPGLPAATFAVGTEPAWSRDGRKLAYVAGTTTDESGWMCPISFNGFTNTWISGTDTVTFTVDLLWPSEVLRIKPHGQSNLNGDTYEWTNAQPGVYAGSWQVSEVLSPTIELAVETSFNGNLSEDWYQCVRTQYHIFLEGSQVQAVHLEGPDLDEVVQLTEGSAVRLWLPDGVYLATPIINGVEELDQRQSITLIGRDGTASWQSEGDLGDVPVPVEPDQPPVVHAAGGVAFLPIVQFGTAP